MGLDGVTRVFIKCFLWKCHVIQANTYKNSAVFPAISDWKSRYSTPRDLPFGVPRDNSRLPIPFSSFCPQNHLDLEKAFPVRTTGIHRITTEPKLLFLRGLDLI